MTLSSIPPYECRHCHDMIHWSETIHEENCLENPKNRCPKCHMKFEGEHNESPQEKIQRHLQQHHGGIHQQGISQYASNGYYYGGLKEGSIEDAKEVSCQFCGQGFESRDQWTAMMYCHQHESLCRSNPQCYRACQYCELTFRSTIKTPAKMQSFIHESNCKFNPKNQCRYCRLQFSGWGRLGAAKESRRKHEAVCRENLDNRASCRYCGLTFQNLTSGIGGNQQVKDHESNCKSNPRNRCPYCDIAFPGPALLTYHFRRCPKKQEADLVNQRAFHHAYSDMYHPNYYFVASPASSSCPVGFYDALFYDHSDSYGGPAFDFFDQSQDEGTTQLTQRPSDGIIRSRADIEIATIESQLQQYYDGSSELRRELKRLLLMWHPDKAANKKKSNTNGSADENHVNALDQEVINEVFRYVNERWKDCNTK